MRRKSLSFSKKNLRFRDVSNIRHELLNILWTFCFLFRVHIAALSLVARDRPALSEYYAMGLHCTLLPCACV